MSNIKGGHLTANAEKLYNTRNREMYAVMTLAMRIVLLVSWMHVQT